MQRFGVKCFAYVDEYKKLDSKSEEAIFLGYDACSPAYIVYVPAKNTLRKARMVKFPAIVANSEINDCDLITYEKPRKQNVGNEQSNNETIEEERRYPERERKKPSYLSDYVKYSVDYCYRVSDVPNNYDQAVKSTDASQWKLAMDDEIGNLNDSGTYELITLPEGKSTIGSRWVFAVKLGPDNREQYKARLVAKGFSQVHGIDYQETFAPTAKITSVRMLLQLAIQNDYVVHQMDVKSAYLNADIDTEIYLDQPDGYIVTNENDKELVWKLRKSLYGLKQSGRNWNALLHSFLTAEGFEQSLSDPCVYTRLVDDNLVILIIWVDDLIIPSTSSDELHSVKASLSSRFRMKDLGKLSWFLGIEFKLKDYSIEMNQSKNIQKMLDRFNMTECHPKPIPCDNVSDFNASDSQPVDCKLYQEIIGSLISCIVLDQIYVSL